ncbi:hypothetical protein, partial [Burkholderia ubonensis]
SRAFNHVGQNSMKICSSSGSVLCGHQHAWGYIAFLEHTQAKEEMAAAFNEAFTGLRGRDWNDADA